MNTSNSRVLQRRFMRPSHQDLGGLGYGFHRNKIPVRVIREWDSCSDSNYYETMTNYILLNAKNTRYWAVADFSERTRLQQLLCVGLLYYISNFRIAPATASTSPIHTDRLIILSKKTRIHELLQSCGIERYKFDLCSWETIVSRVGNPTTLSDVCGVLKGVGNIDYQANNIERLDLTLVKTSLEELPISLWGIKAVLFAINFNSHQQKNLVLIITSLLAKEKHGKLYLASTQATSLSFDPKYEEVKLLGRHIARHYGEFICPRPLETHLGQLLMPNEDPPIKPLKEILKSTLWVHQRYSCEVTIVNVVLHEHHKTISCKFCNKQASLDMEGYYCHLCERNFVTIVSSLGLPLLVKAGDSTALFVIQGPELKQLTGLHVQDYLEYYKYASKPSTTHTCIRNLMGGTCTLEIELAPSAYSNATGDLLVKRILQYTQLRA